MHEEPLHGEMRVMKQIVLPPVFILGKQVIFEGEMLYLSYYLRITLNIKGDSKDFGETS